MDQQVQSHMSQPPEGMPQQSATPSIQNAQPMATGGEIQETIKDQVPDQYHGSKNQVGMIGIILLSLTTLSLYHSIRYYRRALKHLKREEEMMDGQVAEIKVNLKNTMKEIGVPYETGVKDKK